MKNLFLSLCALSLGSTPVLATEVQFNRSVLWMPELFESRSVADKAILDGNLLGNVEYILEQYQLSYEGTVSSKEVAWSFIKKACWGDCEKYAEDDSEVELRDFEEQKGVFNFRPLSSSAKREITNLFQAALKKPSHELRDIHFAQYYYTDGDETDEVGYIFIGSSKSSGLTPDWLIKVSVLRRN